MEAKGDNKLTMKRKKKDKNERMDTCSSLLIRSNIQVKRRDGIVHISAVMQGQITGINAF